MDLPPMSQPHDGSPMSSSNSILIPPGAFIMGTDIEPFYGTAVEQSKHAKMDESPIHVVYLVPYYIDRYPVTNAEYEVFIRATDYPTPAQWKGGKFPPGEGSLPVVSVNWHDAKAYAQWAGKRLPTEPEWEKAARGADGRVYPWGDEFDKGKLNINRSGPTPVGKYSPGGDSSYGAADMSGNVWEWCATQAPGYEVKPYPYKVEDEWTEMYLNGTNVRVVRGGSWLDGNENLARCACRDRDQPSVRGNYGGCRVSSSPSS